MKSPKIVLGTSKKGFIFFKPVSKFNLKAHYEIMIFVYNSFVDDFLWNNDLHQATSLKKAIEKTKNLIKS